MSRVKHPPKRCPECGSTNINYVDLATERGNIVYDTYCYDCNWSGDISPDSDLDYCSKEETRNDNDMP